MTGPLADSALREAVRESLDGFIAARSPALRGIDLAVSELVDSVSAMVAGGKRLRPAFAYWGYLAGGGQHSSELVTACASLELLQACALIHDDVMDASDTRRGQPAVHRRFQSLHAQGPWSGDSAQFGIGAAILAGDLALTWADEMLLTSGLPGAELALGKRVYDTMRSELMAGQYLDLVEQNRRDITVARARTVIRYKSAKYSIEQPILMGASMAGAQPRTLSALSDFGLAVGEAFQLRDDLLGVFGDSATTGKPAGDDLRERKQTVLVALALEAAGDALGLPMASHDDSAEAIALMQRVIAESGAVEKVETMIETSMNDARTALSRADVPDTAHSALARLADAAAHRAA